MDTNTPETPSSSFWTTARKRAAACAAVALVVAIVGAVLVVGHDGSAAASNDPRLPSAGFRGGALPSNGNLDRFRQCLATNGVTLPDPSQQNGPPGQLPDADTSTVRKAMQACRQYAPTPPSGPGPGGSGNPGGGFGSPPSAPSNQGSTT